MDKEITYPQFSMPLRGLLLLAGVYTAIWGAFFRWFGESILIWLSMNTGSVAGLDTAIYGALGLIAGVSILLSAFYPLSWIYLMAFGLLMKIISFSWFFIDYMDGLTWNKRTAFHLIFNEGIWILVVGIILFKAWKVKKFFQDVPKKKGG